MDRCGPYLRPRLCHAPRRGHRAHALRSTCIRRTGHGNRAHPGGLRRSGPGCGGFGGGTGAAVGTGGRYRRGRSRTARPCAWHRVCGNCVKRWRAPAPVSCFSTKCAIGWRHRRAKARPAPADHRSNFSLRCASRLIPSTGARLLLRTRKNKRRRDVAGARIGAAAGCGIRRKPVKLGLPAYLHAKKLRKIRAFSWFCPLHPHALPLSLITFKARARSSIESEIRSMANVARSAARRIIRRNMANVRMTQTQLVRSLAETCEVSNKVARAISG